jgi:molybdopterin/thiamine biosynthesis adenylyltransferase
MQHWWERNERAIEQEARWLEDAGYDFKLDRAMLDQGKVVVFRGHLRLGARMVEAVVAYPPAYGDGDHPIVVAPELEIGRHRSPDGTLCLTHDVLGTEPPMCGAEAVARAERLWELWEHDPDRLAAEEADVPDPWANYVEHTESSALVLIDVDATGGVRGYFRAELTNLGPLRGVVTQVRTTQPTPAVLEVGAPARVLAGPTQITGPWKRLEAAPPLLGPQDLTRWLYDNHREILDAAVELARHDQPRDRPELPALVGLVYPDEGPGRGETHDAWLFAAVRLSDRAIAFPRPFHLHRDERWLRQPELEILDSRHVGILGLGALGSPIAADLARAGVGAVTLVDFDIVTLANRVRHDRDLAETGNRKVHAVEGRLRRINPFLTVQSVPLRYGGVSSGTVGSAQTLDDRVSDALAACDLIVNASAHGVAGSRVSRLGAETETPVVHVWVSAGAWGARILIQRPGRSGCWDCLALAQQDSLDVPSVSADPSPKTVAERGCADLTFTGPNFEIAHAAASTVRIVTQELSDGHYPAADFDLATLTFRTESSARLSGAYTRLSIHPRCTTCN